MKTMVTSSGKGGVGKTASTAHMAWYAAEAGHRVLAIDLDAGNLSKTLQANRIEPVASQFFGEQLTCSDFLAAKNVGQGDAGRLDLISADHLLANLAFMPLAAARANFMARILEVAPAYDLCVIDTAPGLGIKLLPALHVADAVIAPLEMEDYSIQGIADILKVILNVRRENTKLQFLGLLPSKLDRRNLRQVECYDQVVAQHSKMLAPLTIGMRGSIAQALASGVPVWKSRKTSARLAGSEMRALGQYVLDKLGLADKRPPQAQSVQERDVKSPT